MQIWRSFSGVLFTQHDSWNMCFLLKYDSWKLQLESWNTNHESLNQTLNMPFQKIEELMEKWSFVKVLICNQVCHNKNERIESNCSPKRALCFNKRAPLFDKRALRQSRRTGEIWIPLNQKLFLISFIHLRKIFFF